MQVRSQSSPVLVLIPGSPAEEKLPLFAPSRRAIFPMDPSFPLGKLLQSRAHTLASFVCMTFTFPLPPLCIKNRESYSVGEAGKYINHIQ